MKLPELPPRYEIKWYDDFEESQYHGWYIHINGEYYEDTSLDEGIKDRDEAIEECWQMWFSNDLDKEWRKVMSALIEEDDRDYGQGCEIHTKKTTFGPMSLEEMLDYDKERYQLSSEEVVSCLRAMFDKPSFPLYLGDLVRSWSTRFEELRIAAGIPEGPLEKVHQDLLERVRS